MSSNRNRKRKASLSNGSPRKKTKLAEGLLSDPAQFKIGFGQGQIVRISLINWVTFDTAEILPEPGLNLVVGPNGVGKSSIANAICLGCGGKPKNLGRGDKASEFIKFGRDRASIEMELHNNRGNNDVIKRVITHNGSQWALNKKKVSMKQIELFVKEKRNIKVDNLCQFLAQDRVSEFARLTPIQLLVETEKAIEDQQLYLWHKFLEEHGKDADEGQKEMENLRKTLGQNESEKSGLSRTIDQFQRKKTMEKQVKAYEALHAWTEATAKYRIFLKRKKTTEKLKADADKKKANITPMIEKRAEWHKQLVRVDRVWTKQVQNVRKLDKKRKDGFKRIKLAAEAVAGYEEEIAESVEKYKEKMKKIRRAQADVQNLERKFSEFDESEIRQCNERRKCILNNDVKPLRKARGKLSNDLKKLDSQRHNFEHNLRQITDGLERMRNVSRRKDEHIFGPRFRKEREFKLWVDSHMHEFIGEVYGPIAKEMTVTHDLHAKYLNNSVGLSVFYGYVCTHTEDWAKMTRKSGAMQLRSTIYLEEKSGSDSDYIQRPCDHNALRHNGIEGYLDEIYDAPDIIKVTLNKQLSLNMQAYAMQDIGDRSMDAVLLTQKGQSNRLRSLITPNARYSVKVSHYNSNVMRGMNGLKSYGQYGILQRTPDFTAQIEANEGKEREIRAQLDEIEARKREVETARKNVVANINKFANEKKGLEDRISAYTKLKNKLQRKRASLAQLDSSNNGESINSDSPKAMEQKYTALICQKNEERIRTFEAIASDISALTELMKKSSALQVSKQYFESEKAHIAGKVAEIKRRNSALEKDYKASVKLTAKCKRSYEANLQSVLRRFGPRDTYAREWSSEDKQLSMTQIEQKMDHLQGRINALFIDRGKVERYERLTVTIEKQRRALHKLQRSQEQKSAAIKDIENEYKPRLLHAIDKISRKFSEFFMQFNRAQGKVELVCADLESGEDLKYDEWCIDILTKFRRDQREWKRLTSSSQSGGEKSVSTMLYLLSMQQVTTVPFRVVDEINQGMDPINERRIMQILNYECTPKSQSSNSANHYLPQYFVITPKLLPRLKHSPCSTVHVIFNGPFQMAQEYWKPSQFIQTQKELSCLHNGHGSGSASHTINHNNEEDSEGEEEEEESGSD